MVGSVFDIQRFSLHDGPGIRTTVFLKGCNLRCFWCHNPESLRVQPEIEFYPERCIGCGACVSICQHDATSMTDDGIAFRAAQCVACGECVSECFADARVLAGQRMHIDDVFDVILADRQFYADGGGVTLSGGEPLVQPDFSAALLQRCQAEGLHTAIETAGNYPWRVLERVLPHVDLVMMDLKHMDSQQHHAGTGVTNERILATARRLAEHNIPLWFRTPVIPGYNAAPEDITAIARFVRELVMLRAAAVAVDAQPIRYELLRFHQLAGDKYRSLGREYRARDLKPLTKTQMDDLSVLAQRHVAGSCIS